MSWLDASYSLSYSALLRSLEAFERCLTLPSNWVKDIKWCSDTRIYSWDFKEACGLILPSLLALMLPWLQRADSHHVLQEESSVLGVCTLWPGLEGRQRDEQAEACRMDLQRKVPDASLGEWQLRDVSLSKEWSPPHQGKDKWCCSRESMYTHMGNQGIKANKIKWIIKNSNITCHVPFYPVLGTESATPFFRGT